MARNTNIEIGIDEEGGSIDLTLLSPSEHRRYNEGSEVTALLTNRAGKDTDVTADQLEKLGKACLKYAKLMRENY